jgi:hypothetical protein
MPITTFRLPKSGNNSTKSTKNKKTPFQYSQPQYSQPQYSQPQYSQPQYSQPQSYIPDDNFARNPNDSFINDIVGYFVPQSNMTYEEFYKHYNPMVTPLNFSSSRGNDGHQPNPILSFGIPDPSSKKRPREKSHPSSTQQTKRKRTKKGGKSRRGKSRRGKSKSI